MSLTKDTQLGDFVQTGSKKVHGRSAAVKYAEQLSTWAIVWLLVKRHKMALLVTGNIILVLNWAIPEWANIAKSLLQSIVQ